MNRNKKIFLIGAVIFMAIVIWVMIDMASKTTFPGQDKQDSLENVEEDTVHRKEFDQY